MALIVYMLAGYLGAFIASVLGVVFSGWWTALACAPLGGSIAAFAIAVLLSSLPEQEEA